MRMTVMPDNKTYEVQEGSTVLQALVNGRIMLESPCGGKHLCGKCKVMVSKGNDRQFTKEEESLLKKEEKERGMRLACCYQIKEDITVMIPRKRTMSLEIEESKTVKREADYGLAIDIGTTTVEIDVIELKTGHITGKRKFFNPQIMFGADVMSRITYCLEHEEGQEKVRQCLLDQLCEEIKQCLKNLEIEPEKIKRVVFVGNTTMSYLLAGEDVKQIAKAPFIIKYKGNKEYAAKDLSLDLLKETKVYIGPNIGGHVGSDAYACLLATKLWEKEGNHLLVDIGTNGEILLSVNGEIYACSTAAGPAFEGAGISCGMRAVSGAISKAWILENKIVTEVLGQVEAKGISGSGIIDILACMLKLNVMDETGYIKDAYVSENGYEITKHIVVTREDVRQIQLAKGAICTGIECLMRIANISKEELDGIYLAGAFGTNLNIENAMQIGLIPRIDIQKVHNIGNSAIVGAKELLIDKRTRENCRNLLDKIVHIELSKNDVFRDAFIENINFRSLLF